MIEELIRDGKETLVYSIARPEDVEEVTPMSFESFANATPTAEIDAIGNPSDEAGLIAWNRACLEETFAQPTSIIVREKSTNKVVAFSGMRIEERGHQQQINSININDRSPGWLYRAISSELDRDVDLFSRYKTDKILHVWFGAVLKEYRGERILSSGAYRALRDKIIAENGVGVIKTHAYSRYAPAGKNAEVLKTLDLNTFQLSDGSRPLAGVDFGVHQVIRLLATRVPLPAYDGGRHQEKSPIISKL